MSKFITIKISLAIITGLFIASCSNDEEDSPKQDKIVESTDVKSIETLFDSDVFPDPKMSEMLQELNMCNVNSTDTLDYNNPSCTPRFFRFFPMKEKMPIENGFLLQVKSKVSGFPLRRLLVFVRERGQLVKVNGFVANLIGQRKSESGYDDLLLRFNGNEEGESILYNCYFSWNGSKYTFKSVEVIEGANWGGPVKETFKDSMSVEIEKVLNQTSMLF
ncbi:MAG: hypothetical protein NWQ27_01350 [Crocinitomicaceae bacterium]|jgi:hypothetical protein|nr:hypothetical protein [Crocinitomicaceae bacterium]